VYKIVGKRKSISKRERKIGLNVIVKYLCILYDHECKREYIKLSVMN